MVLNPQPGLDQNQDVISCRALPRFAPWMICGFLFLATVLNYMNRQALAVLAPLIQTEMGLDNARLGFLLSAFFYTYGIAQFLAGPLFDRINLRWGLAAAVCGWSLSGVLVGLDRSF